MKSPALFKQVYVDGIPQESNATLEKGISVHEFIEDFFKHTKIENNSLVISQEFLQKHMDGTNPEEKRNFLEYQKEFLAKCIERNPENPGKHFFPILNEGKIKVDGEKPMVGIVDRVHIGFKDEIIIVENKTGEFAEWKLAKWYKDDFYWYKILIEAKYPHWAPIKLGLFYFPKNNAERYVTLNEERKEELLTRIDVVREKIRNAEF